MGIESDVHWGYNLDFDSWPCGSQFWGVQYLLFCGWFPSFLRFGVVWISPWPPELRSKDDHTMVWVESTGISGPTFYPRNFMGAPMGSLVSHVQCGVRDAE